MSLTPLTLEEGERPKLIKIPLTRQATNYTCGVAVAQSLLHYYGDEFRQDVLAQKLEANPDIGTPYENIVKFAQELGYTAEHWTNMTQGDLTKLIDKGIPVTVCFQAWRDEGPIPWKDLWEDGHWAIVVGYDEKRFYFMDPSTLGNYTYINKDEFEDRWHDVDGAGIKLHHFGFVIHKPTVAYSDHHIMPLN